MKTPVAVCLLLSFTSAAQAEWFSTSAGGAFDDNPMNVAVTAKGSYAFGLRCRGDDPEAVYFTPERIDDDTTLKVMNVVSPKLRVRIDKGEIRDFDVKIQDQDGKMAVIGNVDAGLMKQIRDAKSTVSVVLTVLGKNFHENTFSSSGSRAAISIIMKACKVD